MKMKAMKFLKYILIAVLPLAFTACVEEEYAPGTPDRMDCQGLFFPQDQKTDYVISPTDARELTFSVQRADVSEGAEVPYVLTPSVDGIFSMDDEFLYFEEAQSTAKFKVKVSSEAELGKKYTCSIKVTDPQFVSAYGLSSNELTFSVTIVEWKKIKGANGEEKGLWRDDLFTSWGQMLGAPLVQPFAEKEVEIYERSDMPNYFRIANVYTPEYVSYIYAGDESMATALKDYCLAPDLYINATNPDKVYIETQFGLYDPFMNYGAIYFCSDVQENFDSGYSNLYGVYKNGVVEFKIKNSIVLYLPSAGVALANASGKTRLVLPGHKGYDYSVAVSTLDFKTEEGKNILPLQFTVGADVQKVVYEVFEGNLSNVELVSKLEEVKAGKGKEVTASTVLDFTAPATNFYTLIACSFDASGKYQEYDYISFGYDTVEDPRAVDIHMGLIVSDKHGATGRTTENSMEFYIYGSDIKDAKVAIYKSVNYEDFHSSIDSLVQYYMPSFDAYQLDSLNKVGYTGLIDGLAAGVEYTMIAYADNGYHKGIFTTSASTEGEYSPLDEQFQFYDMPKELQAVEQADYCKEWTLWSVDPFTTRDWNRTNRGNVTFAEGDDLWFDSNGDMVTDYKKADPSKTMEVLSLSGMFPKIKEKYGMNSDAIDFHYYEGYIYSLMTQFEKTKVDGTEAFPTNVYLYPVGYSLSPYMENFAMIGGFVRNPVVKESRDIIAFAGNPTASADYIAMCLCWFKDAAYSSDGYLFEEEGHAYPILVNPASEYNKDAVEKVVARASQQTVSNMINAGQTNCVETADGFIKSTIDNFKALPYNYMENLTDVKVTFEHPVADYSVSESNLSSNQSNSFRKATFVERVLR